MNPAPPVPDRTPPPAPAGIAAALRDDLAIAAARRDRHAELPRENVDLLRQSGLLDLPVLAPAPSLPTLAETVRIVAAADSGTALLLAHHLAGLAIVDTAARDGSTAARAWLDSLPRPVPLAGLYAGGSAPDPGLAAVPDPDGLVLDGRRAFASGCEVTAWGICPVRLPGDDGIALVAIALPDPAIAIEATWDTMGMRSALAHDLVFHGARVPKAQVLWQGQGRVAGAFLEQSAGWGLACFTAISLGICEAAWAWLRRLVVDRLTPDHQSRLVDRPGMLDVLGAQDLAIREMTALYRWTLHLHGNPAAWDAESLRALAAMKDGITRQGVAFLERCIEIVGGAAYYRRMPLERWYRDIRSGPLHPFAPHAVQALLGAAAVAPYHAPHEPAPDRPD